MNWSSTESHRDEGPNNCYEVGKFLNISNFQAAKKFIFSGSVSVHKQHVPAKATVKTQIYRSSKRRALL